MTSRPNRIARAADDIERIVSGRAPAGYETGACRHCGAPVFWATLTNWLSEVVRRNGRPIRLPIDTRPVPAGDMKLIPGGRGRVRPIGRQELVDEHERYRRHHCPNHA